MLNEERGMVIDGILSSIDTDDDTTSRHDEDTGSCDATSN